ncbi:hypothetical protein L6259_04205 [Candidatus Parcubacteria bacterium]|nr:hypothetical protein [Patescibacteria group bacterium]MCG2694441.1 hypothetical protein [Candidatus Parcubacteria bacterium]
MIKINKIFLSIMVFCAVSAVIFIVDSKIQAKAEACYYPFMMIDKMDEVYSHAICEDNYQIYYFPVIADGREYTITLHSIKGEQKLYASRYKGEVDEYEDFNRWYCNDDHCDSSIHIDEKTKIVKFISPTGEPGYYSWFAVYGKTASEYQIGISNNGMMQFLTTSSYLPDSDSDSNSDLDGNSLPIISWKASSLSTSNDLDDIEWTKIIYNDNYWKDINLPDSDWNCNDCYKKYRGTFELSSVPSDLKIHFASDDGIWLYVNGKYIGHWGSDNFRDLKCANGPHCATNENVADIILSNLVFGTNIISAVVLDSGLGEYFDLELKN